MKSIILLGAFLVCAAYVIAQTNTFPSSGSVGIGTVTPAASSKLEIQSTTKGILIPRMTAAQKNAIVSPATGLLIYQTNSTPGFYYYNGSKWTAITPKTSWSLNGNSGTNPSANFLGTTDAEPLVFKVNNTQAGYLDYSSSYNTGFGYETLFSNTSGSNNTAFGSLSLSKNTTGYNNTAHGDAALLDNTTGTSNTAIGSGALFLNTTGSQNTAQGSGALYVNNSGNYNTANGSGALSSNTTGGENTANGYQSLFSNTGSGNTASGSHALYSNTSGYANAANGSYALYDNTTGGDNTADGNSALYSNTTGSYNTGVGTDAFFIANNLNNTTCIGYNSGGIVNADNRIEIGNTSVTWIGGEVGWSTYSDGRVKENLKYDVPGLTFINKLRPVSYNYNIHKQNEILYKNKKNKAEWSSKYDIEKQRFTGFIAQDVERAMHDLKCNFSGLVKPKNENDLYSLRYSDFVVPLVKSVQELSAQNDNKQKQIDSLQLNNQLLNDKLNALSEKVNQIETAMSQCCNSFSSNMQTIINNQPQEKNLSASLQQNIPNPFNQSSTIHFYIPSSAINAAIFLTDASGKAVKQFNNLSKGTASVTIDANTFSSGNYLYSLIVDGKTIATKKMIITH